MKREDAYVGAEVYTDDGPLYRYKVVEVPDEQGMVKVKPTNESWASGSHDSFHLDDLILYEPRVLKLAAGEMQAKIDEAKNAFEEAFKAFKQVQNFRSEDGSRISHYDLEEMGLISMEELEKTVESYGWSMSSLRC